MKKDLENELRKLYSEVPSPNPSSINETVLKVRRIVNETLIKGLTFWEFYFQQFGFIRKKIWIIQFAILLFCGLKLYYYSDSIQGVTLIASITPLIFLSGITELSRTYTYRTVELELSTQYTLKQVMMSRISILGIIDILSITLLGIMAKTSTLVNPYTIFLYICVPFMITCFGCLWILNRFKNKECNYYCFAFGVFTMIAVSMSTAFAPKLYIASSLWIWSIMLVIALIGVAIQIYKLANSYREYDYINLTHI